MNKIILITSEQAIEKSKPYFAEGAEQIHVTEDGHVFHNDKLSEKHLGNYCRVAKVKHWTINKDQVVVEGKGNIDLVTDLENKVKEAEELLAKSTPDDKETAKEILAEAKKALKAAQKK